jgi:hypothetical protein
MPEISEGSFTIDFGVVKLGGKLSEQDRQCAWQLYAEIVTRVAVCGKRRDETCSDFSGEVFAESLSSLHAFFQEARQIMKAFPVGKLKEKNQCHLGILIHDLLADVLRPFLEKWQADFRAWSEQQDRGKQSWFELQRKYPRYGELLADWTDLRKLMRKLEDKLRDEYKLQKIDRGGV